MKARQRKKLSKKAMQLMIELNYAKADDFSMEDGEWVRWFPCGGYGDDWDYRSPWDDIHEHAFYLLSVFEEDGRMWQSRKLKNAKDVFSLFRSDISKFNSWVLG